MPNISVDELSQELRAAISNLEVNEGLERAGIVITPLRE